MPGDLNAGSLVKSSGKCCAVRAHASRVQTPVGPGIFGGARGNDPFSPYIRGGERFTQENLRSRGGARSAKCCYGAEGEVAFANNQSSVLLNSAIAVPSIGSL